MLCKAFDYQSIKLTCYDQIFFILDLISILAFL